MNLRRLKGFLITIAAFPLVACGGATQQDSHVYCREADRLASELGDFDRFLRKGLEQGEYARLRSDLYREIAKEITDPQIKEEHLERASSLEAVYEELRKGN